jgi:hypothetical protein
MLAGQCPWCGYVIIEGRAFKSESQLFFDELARLFPHWGLVQSGLAPVPPEAGDVRSTDYLLAIIEQYGRDAKTAIPLLRAALSDTDWGVRLAAANALGRIGPDAKEALPALWPLLEDKDQIVRDAAEEAIKNIDQ